MSNILSSYIRDAWQTPPDEGRPLVDAATGEEVARWTTQPADPAALDHARQVGGPALRELTFHQRAAILKSLAKYLNERTGEFYECSLRTGATARDSAVDIDGGIGVLFVYASKGTRELPGATYYIDGARVQIGKEGTFVAQHIATSLLGTALQINAFNFPVWGMLEKFAPAFLAGVPTVVKPASQTAYLTELVFRRMIESGLLPEGSIQLLAAGVGDLLEHMTGQDAVSFTGSATTAHQLRAHPTVVARATRFNAEADSLNYAILGPDATSGTAEFDLFVKAVVAEMTVKAGQKCTAIRRAFVPAAQMDEVQEAIRDRLANVTVGHPAEESVRMGPLASTGQRDEVRRSVKELRTAAELVYGDPEHVDVTGADAQRGAFVSPMLLRCDDPDRPEPHDVEAFGPVSTLMPYQDTQQVIDYAARGHGSLVGSVVSHDDDFVRDVVLGTAPWHGRLHVLDRDDAQETTGHGSPLPHLVHGGPGRAGGGEELGGIRGVLHYMQRTAVQGSPAKVGLFTGGASAE